MYNSYYLMSRSNMTPETLSLSETTALLKLTTKTQHQKSLQKTVKIVFCKLKMQSWHLSLYSL